jgi:hypothetical protein
MHLIQMLLPLQDNHGHRFPRDDFDRTLRELIERWGGATAFLESPAAGAWREEGAVSHDQVVMIEVMTEELDQEWWKRYREELKQRFKQEELVIRATVIEML